jgi:DNA-binding NarL/FixJ family response regulator
MTTTVLIADDHTMVRKGLVSLLAGEDQLEVVGEAADGREALQLAKKLHPDIILLDLSMPGMNGLEAARRLKTDQPGLKIIILTRYTDREYIEQSFLAGASGFVVKISAPEELVKAVRTVSRGALYLDSGLEETPAPALLANQAGEESLHKKLTPRQREVLQLIAEGHPNREIARILQISVKTVETHRENLLKRLGVHSTAGLTRYAIRMGLIQLDQ